MSPHLCAQSQSPICHLANAYKQIGCKLAYSFRFDVNGHPLQLFAWSAVALRSMHPCCRSLLRKPQMTRSCATPVDLAWRRFPELVGPVQLSGSRHLDPALVFCALLGLTQLVCESFWPFVLVKGPLGPLRERNQLSACFFCLR